MLLTCIIDEAKDVVGATPEGMEHHILSSVKITLNARFNIILYVLLHFIPLHWLFYIPWDMQGGGPSHPPKSATGQIWKQELLCVSSTMGDKCILHGYIKSMKKWLC